MKILSKSPLATLIESDMLGNAENRLDVVFYHPKYINAFDKVLKLGWPIEKLGDIAEMIIQGPNPKDWAKEGEGIICLKTKNVYDDGMMLDSIDRISRKEYEGLKRFTLVKNDILVTLKGFGSIGKVSRFDLNKKAVFTREIGIIRLRGESPIKPEFLEIFLKTRVGKENLLRGITGATGQLTLTTSYMKSIQIPIPPISVQKGIIQIMKNAYKQRTQKLKRAEELLHEINNLVPDRLHIKLPTGEIRKMYLAELEEDFEKRVDVFFYHPQYIHLLEAIQGSPNEVEFLKEISKAIVSGQRPKGGVKYIKEGIPSIGGEHITSEGDFDFEDIRYIPKDFHQKQKKSWVKPFDILVVKDGATTGKTAIISEDFPFKECNINEHVFKIEVKEGYNPYYVFCYLFSSLGQEQINRLISGAAQKGITRHAIESVKIIVPPLEIQDTIADEVRRRKEDSKKLKREAEEVVERAKKLVERMIAG